MSPAKILLSTLNRCWSSTLLKFCDGSVISRFNQTTLHYSGIFGGVKDIGVTARYSPHQNVKLLTSSAESTEDPNQYCDPAIFQCLLDNGFPEDASREILLKLLPLRLDANKLNHALSSWGACQFGQQRLVYLLTENPDLVLVDHLQITSAFTFFSNLFTQNYVYKIFLNCPQAILEKRSEVSSKLDFLNKKLGVPNSQIVSSSALGQPLEHMRLRYEFLKRCGVYKIAAGSSSPTNPSLSDMFETSDEQFARNVARLSPLEFEVFTHLFVLEDHDDENTDSDSD